MVLFAFYLVIIFRSKNKCVQVLHHLFPSVLPMVCFTCNKNNKEKHISKCFKNNKHVFSRLFLLRKIKDICAEKLFPDHSVLESIPIPFLYLSYQKSCFVFCSVFESFEGIKILLVNLALEHFGDTMREFEIFFYPLSPFSVLNGHSCYTCMKQSVIFTLRC